MIMLDLPWPPSVNHYWRLGNGHFHISTEGQRYKRLVGGILATERIRPVEGHVKITLDAFPPDRRRRDIDNFQKFTLDSCVVRRGFATGLYFDDSQIKRLETTMWDFDAARSGRVLLTLSPWPDPQGVCVPAMPKPPVLNARRRWEEEPEPTPLSRRMWRQLLRWWHTPAGCPEVSILS